MNRPLDPVAASRDRFFTTFFLAALFHGILIIGVTFSAPTPPGGMAQAFEVLLVRDAAREKRAEQADYLAQVAQDGAGNTLKAVSATSVPAAPLRVDRPGARDGSALADSMPGLESEAPDLVVSRDSAIPPVAAVPDPTRAPDPRTAAALRLESNPDSDRMVAEPDEQTQIRGDPSRVLIVTGRTQESRIAPYLDRWKRKVERIGTLNFPDQARRQRLSGSPTLEVAIRADGTLEAIVVRRSSGEKLLDQAALGILRLAAPFEPFPSEIREEYDVLRFVYEWQFIGGVVHDSTVRTLAPE
jgi:protein TonB